MHSFLFYVGLYTTLFIIPLSLSGGGSSDHNKRNICICGRMFVSEIKISIFVYWVLCVSGLFYFKLFACLWISIPYFCFYFVFVCVFITSEFYCLQYISAYLIQCATIAMGCLILAFS